MRIFILFDTGGRIWKDCSSSDEARGFVDGAAATAEYCRLRAWVAAGRPGDEGTDDGAWLPPDEWLKRNPLWNVDPKPCGDSTRR